MSKWNNKKNLVYYSVNTKLAYQISEHYFKGNHYVWGASFFDNSLVNPPSSNPREIYENLKSDCDRNDKHSEKIAANKASLIKAAKIKCEEGIITEDEKNEIFSIIQEVDNTYFEPLLYVIPCLDDNIELKKTSHSERAAIFSEEYIIPKLPRDKFHVLQY